MKYQMLEELSFLLIHVKILSITFLFLSAPPWPEQSGDRLGGSRGENILSYSLFVWKLWGAGTRLEF